MSYDICVMLPCVLPYTSFEIIFSMGTVDGQKNCKTFLIELQYEILFILLTLLD